MTPASLERTRSQSVTWRTHAVGFSLVFTAYLAFLAFSLVLDKPALGTAASLTLILISTICVAVGVLLVRQIAANYLILYRYQFWGLVPFALIRFTISCLDVVEAFAGFKIQIVGSLLPAAPDVDLRSLIEPIGILAWAFLMKLLYRLEAGFASQRNAKVSTTMDRLIVESNAAALKLHRQRQERQQVAKRDKKPLRPELLIGNVKGRRCTYPVGERLVVAPQGAGKGKSFVIPTALTYPASMVFVDQKAELAAVTSRYRVTLGGIRPQRIVYLLDPYRLTDEPGFKDPRLALAGFIRRARFNPFASVDVEDSLTVMRDLDFAVEAIVDRSASKKSGAEEHFEQGTINVIRGVAYAGLYYRAKGLARDRGEDTPISPHWVYMTLRDVMENPLKAVPWLRRAGGAAQAAATVLAAAGDRERGSYITTALRMLSWLEDQVMGKIVTDTTVNIDLIFKGYADVYIILPANLVDARGRWIIGLLKAFFSLHESSPKQRLPRKGKEVLYMLDELGQLGGARPVQESWTRLRGYGGRICAIFQTRAHQERFEMASVFETADVVQIFGTNDSATIEWFTKSCGRMIIERQTINEGQQGNMLGGQGGGLSGGRQISQTEVDYVTPEVIRELGDTRGIALVKGIGTPVLFDQADYFEDPLLAGLYDENPLEREKEAS